MVWDGRRWARDKGKQVQRWAHAVARRMLVWAARVEASDERKRALRAAEYACSAGGNAAMLTMASAVEWIATEADVFDANPDLLNCANGIVDLRTGELHPHDPKHLITLCTGVNYVKGATHPDWSAALTAMSPGEVAWFQVRAGQGFTGYPPDDDVLLLMRGGGENGKSTLVIGIAQSGGDYARLISERALLADPRAHPTELMEFKGCRFAYTEELPEGGTLNAARLKKTVGTPTMTARAMHRDSETWIATHSMFLGTNPLPVVNETDHGTWRRLLLQEYRVKYLKPGDPGTGAPHERRGDPGLRTRLRDGKAQHEAVLAWLVEGARHWYEAGRVMPAAPPSVVASTDAWRAKSDLVFRYFSERLRADPEYLTSRSEVYADFSEWLKANGQSEWSRRTFDDRFLQHDLVSSAGIRERTVKPQGKKLSKRVDSWSQTLPSTLKVWSGVRFVLSTEEDEDAED